MSTREHVEGLVQTNSSDVWCTDRNTWSVSLPTPLDCSPLQPQVPPGVPRLTALASDTTKGREELCYRQGVPSQDGQILASTGSTNNQPRDSCNQGKGLVIVVGAESLPSRGYGWCGNNRSSSPDTMSAPRRVSGWPSCCSSSCGCYTMSDVLSPHLATEWSLVKACKKRVLTDHWLEVGKTRTTRINTSLILKRKWSQG